MLAPEGRSRAPRASVAVPSMRVVPVALGSIFLIAAAVVYFDPNALSSVLPPEPTYPGEIQYASILAFTLGITGLGLLLRGLISPSAASMRARAQEMMPQGYPSQGYPPQGAAPGGGVVPGTVYCAACGRANSTSASFCQGCGRALPPPPQ
jgi:hypothetical protein